MRISYTNNFNQTNFQATKIASIKPRIKGLSEAIDIYELGNNDRSFLKQLLAHVKFKELLPNLDASMQKRWQQIFNYCVETPLINPDLNVVVAVCKEKLCGILTYMSESKNLYLEGISALPDKEGNKTPLVGQTLFTYFFDKAKKDNIKKIKLDAVTDGPIDVIKKYEELGFKKENTILGKLTKDEDDHIYQPMSCNKYNIEQTQQALSDRFTITKTSGKEETNLSKFLS